MSKKQSGSDKNENSAYKEKIRSLQRRLVAQQQTLRAKGLPIIVLVEGWAAAGKGSLINSLISELDPRFYNVTSLPVTPEAQMRYPFLYPYATALPENGKIMFFDSGWMEDCEEDLWQHREYGQFRKCYESFMEKTGKLIPWHVVDGTRRNATYESLCLLTELTDRSLDEGRFNGKPFKEDFPLLRMPKLSEVDLSPVMPDEEYGKQLKILQNRLGELHNIVYRKKIPVILCYEGWDAAGKGGNIRRIAKPLDPRGFDVIPIAAPEPHELARHYLWRFWTSLPKSGHIRVFDRTWYGRVMVERLEGFCTEDDWKRAFNEINEFERQLTDWGAVVLKFWMHIDQDTQLSRFTDRQNIPEKQWKLTEEDWRNREKWPQYEEAVDEMLQKTSTENAPWFIIESNDKKFARIKTLRILIDALEKACRERLK